MDPLSLDPETMRRLGDETLRFLIPHVSEVEEVPVVGGASPEAMRERLDGPPPEAGEDFARILEDLADHVIAAMVRGDHPGYLAFIPGQGTWPGALADFIASALNLYGGSWKEGAGPAQLELTVLSWFKSWIGYPETASGILTSGGSVANLTALACAREAMAGAGSDRLLVYLSDQAHSSMARAARILGFPTDRVRVLPTDDTYRLRPEVLRQAIAADRRAGWQPFFLGAAAGTTNTGAVDPLVELSAVCRESRMWFHIDGAYGAFVVLSERGRDEVAGMELADSITLDPHKWLYQPFECGCVLVRDGPLLRNAFEIAADYLDVVRGGEAVNFADLGMQLTRSTRALKVWMSIRYFGLDAFRRAIDRAIELAEHAQRRIESSPAFELLSPRSLGVVTFRRRFDDTADEAVTERRNRALLHSLEETGRAFLTSTRLHGRYAIRICVLNHSTERRHVDFALDWLERAPVEALDTAEQAAAPDRDRPVRTWPPR